MNGSKVWASLAASFLLPLTLGVLAGPLAHAAPLVPAGGAAPDPLSPGLVAALIAGAVAVIGGLIFLFLFLRRRNKDDEDAPAGA